MNRLAVVHAWPGGQAACKPVRNITQLLAGVVRPRAALLFRHARCIDCWGLEAVLRRACLGAPDERPPHARARVRRVRRPARAGAGARAPRRRAPDRVPLARRLTRAVQEGLPGVRAPWLCCPATGLPLLLSVLLLCWQWERGATLFCLAHEVGHATKRNHQIKTHAQQGDRWVSPSGHNCLTCT